MVQSYVYMEMSVCTGIQTYRYIIHANDLRHVHPLTRYFNYSAAIVCNSYTSRSTAFR